MVTEITTKGCTLSFVKKNLVFSRDNANPTSKLLLSVMGAIAEFERSLIKERQREGIAVAKSSANYKPGRKRKISQENLTEIKELYNKGVTISKIATKYQVSRPTLYRALKL